MVPIPNITIFLCFISRCCIQLFISVREKQWWIQQPKRGKAASASQSLFQLVTRIRMYFQWPHHTGHTQRAHKKSYVHICLATRSQANRAVTQTQTAPTASSCSPLWLRRMEVQWQEGIHMCICAYVQGGSLQQVDRISGATDILLPYLTD